jgi:uncharacterized low-complexity protein
VHHEAVLATAMVVAAAVVATGMRAEEEAGEEDRSDDEDHACDDANPGSHRGKAAVAVPLNRDGRCGRGFCGGHGAGCGFRRRRCFAHDSEHASDVDVPVMNPL